MEKKVLISVKNRQAGYNNAEDVYELLTEGIYASENNIFEITYNESEVTGMNGTTTKLVVDGKIITVTRTGTVNSQFVFEKGCKHICHYDTGFGAFTIGVYTRKLESDLDANGGDLSVDYSIEVNNHDTGRNNFQMTITEKKLDERTY